jgi:FtsP/CotA-like multicopper oxidase with cupredoxin domain
MDGSPLTQDPVLPGGSFDYVFTPPDAGTFWYHSLFNGAEQRERGLYGMLVIEERVPDPQLFDVPVILDDWRIDAGGALDEAAFGDAATASGEGRLGSQFTVNGRLLPTIRLKPGRLTRLRMLNAANARHFKLSLDAAGASAIAFDGQPCAPLRLDAPLTLAPGQRADVIVASAGRRSNLALLDGNRSVPLVRFTAGDGGRPPGEVFSGLPANAVADYFNVSAVTDVTYTIEGGFNSRLAEARLDGTLHPMAELRRRGLHFAVNGSAGLGPEPLFRARAGVTVAVTVDNITRVPQVLHIHGHAAWLIERGGRRLDRAIWHDTFIADPLEPMKVLFIADNPGRWLIASAVAEHFAAGCQAWFEVLP